MRTTVRRAALLLPLLFTGCSAVGGVMESVGSLLTTLVNIAVAALPFAAWYYYRNRD